MDGPFREERSVWTDNQAGIACPERFFATGFFIVAKPLRVQRFVVLVSMVAFYPNIMGNKDIIASPPSSEERAAMLHQPAVTGLAERPVAGVAPRIKQALGLLLESYDYAQDVGCDLWEFAVEADHLLPLGLTASDCRWLHYRGLVEHARELTALGEDRRTFRRGGVLKINRRTCFVLTETGEQFARTLAGDSVVIPMTAAPDLPPGFLAKKSGLSHDSAPNVTPTWDRDRQQLRVGRIIVKEFKVPAPNQEAILSAFQEENWAPRIDDPLPPLADVEPKRRLHDTISSLNRNQREPLIRFLGDGSGQGARWEFTRQFASNGQH